MREKVKLIIRAREGAVKRAREGEAENDNNPVDCYPAEPTEARAMLRRERTPSNANRRFA